MRCNNGFIIKFLLLIIFALIVVGGFFYIFWKDNKVLEIKSEEKEQIESVATNTPSIIKKEDDGSYIIKTNSTTTNSITLDDVKNLSYDLGNGVVKFTDGKYSDNEKSADIKLTAFGDLNNDKNIDAIVIVELSLGNSPISTPYVVLNQGGGVFKTARLNPFLPGTNPYFGISKVAIDLGGGSFKITYHPDKFSTSTRDLEFSLNTKRLDARMIYKLIYVD